MKDRISVCALALTCALVPAVLAVNPAEASEKGGGGGGCPWAQDVTLEIGNKTLKLGQDAFTSTEPLSIDGFQIYPLVNQLKLRILGPKGQEWEAALTRLQGGKRCNAFYVGKAFQVSDSEDGDGLGLVLTR
ncbi:hypothetical protein [Azospirillum sp. sgz302134]